MTTPHTDDKTIVLRRMTRLKKVLSFLLPLGVLLVAIALAVWLTKSGPKAGKRPVIRNAVLVETQPVTITPQQVRISASGTVQASREVELKAQVSGAVVAVSTSLLPGGYLRKGATLVEIDPRDYTLAVRRQENNVARVEAELQQESGNQLLARKEYELLGSQVSDAEIALMLRQPQLQSLQADLDSAKAALEQARLNLKRTRVTVPFDGIVATQPVNVGSQITPATPLATLVASDSFWIEVTLPVAQLHWISIPRNETQTGATAHITNPAVWGSGIERQGRVLRLLPGLEEQGRMARLLIEVNDPLSLQANNASLPPLLIGSWVQVTIDGQELPAVAALDRAWLHDGNQVWLRDADGTLEIRTVEAVFRDRERVLVANGLRAGEELITSRLSAPVAGMKLRTKADSTEASTTVEKSTGSGEPPR